MEPTGKEDLFGLKINDSGKLYIRKFATIARTAIFIGIIISLIHITQIAIHAIKVNPAIYGKNSLLLLEHNIMPYYTAVSSVLLFLQLYYYWKVSSCLTKAVDDNNEILLNKSFNALYHYAAYGMVSLIFALLFSFFDLYLTINRHLY